MGLRGRRPRAAVGRTRRAPWTRGAPARPDRGTTPLTSVAGSEGPRAARSTAGATATFLFTDIEGSTRLEQAVGTERYGQIRERHRALLRTAFTAEGGDEQGTEGDSFFVAFPSARSALAAAVAGQRALAAEAWPDDAGVRVRMGLHSGEASMAGGTLVGLDINRAARIAAAAHGGQILISDASRGLVASALPEGVTLRDLGEFRLRDLLSPERLVQVDVDGLPSSFPPPRTLDVRANNLPTQLTTFVGRDAELDEASGLLDRARLLTLTGPGGTGKTRLSLQLAARVADRFRDGVYFVPLEPVRDPALVVPRIATTLGLVESGAKPIHEMLAEWLEPREVLVVLDNFEQVIDAAPVVADLLRAADRLRVIATSRAPLRISGEQEYPVPGLPVPPDPTLQSGLDRLRLTGEERVVDAASIGHYEAVRLFVERALAVRPGFSVTNQNAPAVAAIAARLQGMPLAIELAAARIKLLTPEAILTRLEHQLDVLAAGGRDLPARQQTLRGAIAWSYDLLDEGGQKLLDRLSVFARSTDLASAEAICGPSDELGRDVADGLLSLADQSLVRVDDTPDGEPRFRLLDTIREFASEHLAARGETSAIGDRHAAWFTTVVEEAGPQLAGDEQRRWLDRLEQDHDDIRAVLERAVARGDAAAAIPLAFAMWRFWQKHGHLGEARRRLEAIAAAPWSREDPRLRARLVEALGGVCWWQADFSAMRGWYEEALALWLDVGDEREIANAYYNASFIHSIGSTGVLGPDSDPDGIGQTYIEEARRRFRAVGDDLGEANTLWALGNYRYFRGEPDITGIEDFREALAIYRKRGDRTMEAWALHMLGSGLLRIGETEEARGHVLEAIRHFYQAGDAAGLTLTFDDLSAVAVQEGDLVRAARLRGAARSLATETGAGLATFVEDSFEQGVRPSIRGSMSTEDVERYGAEGAAMSIDEAVAYAMEGSGTGEGDDAR